MYDFCICFFMIFAVGFLWFNCIIFDRLQVQVACIQAHVTSKNSGKRLTGKVLKSLNRNAKVRRMQKFIMGDLQV